jgi:hypothetical protein
MTADPAKPDPEEHAAVIIDTFLGDYERAWVNALDNARFEHDPAEHEYWLRVSDAIARMSPKTLPV